MMSLPSALLGFAIFKTFASKLAHPFTDVENVFVQSIAVAVGTGPLAYGFVGIIPAIEKFLTPEESGFDSVIKFNFVQLVVWSLGLAFFGVFFAIPLRKQVIVKEKLPFPSGSATATLISVLHNTELYDDDEDDIDVVSLRPSKSHSNDVDTIDNSVISPNCTILESQDLENLAKIETYRENMRSLITTFCVSSTYTILSYFIPFLRSIPVFGTWLSRNYLWYFQPSPAYIGQGIIMGLPTVSYMLFGAILGWGVLAPMAKQMGWAPGEIDDWKTGGQGWILWISLSVMVSDSVVSFIVVVTKSLINLVSQWNHSQTVENESLLNSSASLSDENSATHDGTPVPSLMRSKEKEYKDVADEHLVPTSVIVIGLLASTVLCILAIRLVFGSIIPIYASLTAIVVALFLSILGVRALGETDLNPVSGIGKLSQLIFALIVPSSLPGAVLINLVAGGLAEAGAQQAGDLMQDLKTGHLIGASPRLQFVAQMIGTVYSVFLSSIMYRVYDSVYEIPGKLFRVPTAVIWIDCSRLVTGKGLPPYAVEFSLVFGIIFGLISLVKNIYPKDHPIQSKMIFLPSGVAVGIGLYNTPSFTLARFIGGVIAHIWMKKTGHSHSGRIAIIIFSSGLVLGEGLFSSFTMLLTSLGVPHL